MGRSPCLIPPLTHNTTLEAEADEPESAVAISLIECIALDVSEVQDNLLAVKINQAEFANCRDKVVFVPSNKVMLSMEHCCREYKQAKSGCVAKFMPCSDSPFVVTQAYPAKSSYTLHLPN